jgi:hypothetical protein
MNKAWSALSIAQGPAISLKGKALQMRSDPIDTTVSAAIFVIVKTFMKSA